MSKRICGRCGSTDIDENSLRGEVIWCNCNRCKYFAKVADFPEQTLFSQITQSYETLAEKLVYETAVEGRKTVYDTRGRGVGVQSYIDYVWKSSVTGDDIYTSKDEALSATMVKLKEVVK